MKTLIFSFLLSFLAIPLVAQPQAWNIQREVVKIPMRDGVNLEAILYKPAGEGRFPAIVYRTPYGKDEYDGYAMFPLAAAKEGFAVFLVDVRGRFGSENSKRIIRSGPTATT